MNVRSVRFRSTSARCVSLTRPASQVLAWRIAPKKFRTKSRPISVITLNRHQTRTVSRTQHVLQRWAANWGRYSMTMSISEIQMPRRLRTPWTVCSSHSFRWSRCVNLMAGRHTLDVRRWRIIKCQNDWNVCRDSSWLGKGVPPGHCAHQCAPSFGNT